MREDYESDAAEASEDIQVLLEPCAVDQVHHVEIQLQEDSSQNFIQHQHNPDEEERLHAQKNQQKIKKNKMIKCSYCAKLVRNIEIHILKFHSEKKERLKKTTTHQCELCGYATNRLTNYDMHVKMVHLKVLKVNIKYKLSWQ